MGPFGFSETEIVPFFASLTRVIALFVVLPIFSDNTVPAVVRLFLAFTVNMVVFPMALANGWVRIGDAASSDLGIAALVLKEGAVGFSLGFVAKLFFEGLSFAFGHMGTQMGFNMASAYDHHTEANMPVISHLIMILATLLFLALDGHHLFLRSLVQSYEAVPVGQFVLTKTVASYLLETATEVFWIAVKLSAPMALVTFVLNCAFGIVAKAVPQINVFVVSFAVNILAGLLVISLTMPVFGSSVGEVFQLMAERMSHLMKILS